MKILQGGVPKCGNFWLWQILQHILKMSGRDHTGFIEKQPIYELAKNWELNFPEQSRIDVIDITDLQVSYRISSIYKMPLDDIRNYLDHTNHVWTHSPICKRSPHIFEHFDKKIYIIRDPRDRAISAARYYTSPYMLKYFPQEEKDPDRFLEKNFENLMHEWVWHVWDHLRMSQIHNIHIIFYESLRANFQQELSKLLDYLNIDLTEAQKSELEKSVSFERLKKGNPKHLKKGKFGYWAEKFSDQQLNTTLKIAGPLLQYLGYPEHRNLNYCLSERTSLKEIKALKKEIINCQETLYI